MQNFSDAFRACCVACELRFLPAGPSFDYASMKRVYTMRDRQRTVAPRCRQLRTMASRAWRPAVKRKAPIDWASCSSTAAMCTANVPRLFMCKVHVAISSHKPILPLVVALLGWCSYLRLCTDKLVHPGLELGVADFFKGQHGANAQTADRGL